MGLKRYNEKYCPTRSKCSTRLGALSLFQVLNSIAAYRRRSPIKCVFEVNYKPWVTVIYMGGLTGLWSWYIYTYRR